MARRGDRLVLAASVLGSVIACTSAAWAWCVTTTQKPKITGDCAEGGYPLSWDRSLVCAGMSVYFAGSPDISLEQIRVETEKAVGRWNTAPCGGQADNHPYFQVWRIGDTTTPTGYNPGGVNANTISFNDVWASDERHRDDTIAITVVTYEVTNGQIYDADIEMNQKDYPFTTGMPDQNAADLPTILTHEIGHFHGLGHTDKQTAVMWYAAGLGEQRRDPRPDDIQGICTMYPPELANNTPCNRTPYGGWAVTPTGGKVIGACSIARIPEPTDLGRASSSGIAVLMSTFVFRRRRSTRQ